MTKQKTFKRSIRARMQKTGESYTAARRQLIAADQRPATGLRPEFDRQVETLVARGYPAAAGLSGEAFRRRLAPLARRLSELPGADTRSRIRFAIVIGDDLVARETAIGMLDLDGRPGFTDMDQEELARFGPIAGLSVPYGGAYLVTDLDTGPETLNVTPEQALPLIEAAGRSPLTIDEGVALVTQRPELLRERNCFSLLGSRCGDRRVPAVWIKQGGRPRLGWCWAAAPHTWLGSASCASRLGAG
jgi:hypothetical protein